MKKLILAVPCIVMGMILGASTLSQALDPPLNAPQGQTGQRTNVVVLAPYMDEYSHAYECDPGRAVTSCIYDSITALDDDSTFKLLAGANAIRCGASQMALGQTCTYTNSTFGGTACIDGVCPVVKVDPDQN